ncbi:MAG TPA: 4Fe-4S dicluster domain-containing protein [Verrucomicrobiae bacterium]|nr:4Fe-4S dicluster domain-containing protein [Verrucomicrobiae bacterium]
MGRIEIDEKRCKGCGLCTTACSRKLITLADRINTSGYTPAEFTTPEPCTGCALCAELCPDVAITVFR